MNDTYYAVLITSVLAFVVGLVVLGLYGSAVADCEAVHGVLVTSAGGWGWECLEKKK